MRSCPLPGARGRRRYEEAPVQREIDDSPYHLLLCRNLEGQGVRHHFPARHNPRHLLHGAGEHPAAFHFDAPELRPPQGHVDPIAVVEMEDCACRDHGVGTPRRWP